MESVHFEPWIGDKYHSQDRRILILGESHHHDPADKPDNLEKEGGLTKFMVQEYITGESGPQFKFWTNFMQAITGKKQWEIDRKDFWSKHAFYNYIQEPLAGPRKAPSPVMWREAWEPFCQIVDELKPTHILVMGKRLWNEIPQDGGREGKTIVVNGNPWQTWYFPCKACKGGEVVSTYIHHPCSAFSSEKWHQFIKAFLEKH